MLIQFFNFIHLKVSKHFLRLFNFILFFIFVSSCADENSPKLIEPIKEVITKKWITCRDFKNYRDLIKQCTTNSFRRKNIALAQLIAFGDGNSEYGKELAKKTVPIFRKYGITKPLKGQKLTSFSSTKAAIDLLVEIDTVTEKSKRAKESDAILKIKEIHLKNNSATVLVTTPNKNLQKNLIFYYAMEKIDNQWLINDIGLASADISE